MSKEKNECDAAQPLVPPPPDGDLAQGQVRCPHCGEALYASEKQCWRCGHPLAEAAPPPPPVTVPPAAPDAPALPPSVAVRPAVGRGVTALVLGVMGIVFPCLAPVFSFLALREAARVGEAKAAGIVTAARVVAVLGLVAFALGLMVIVIGRVLWAVHAR